MKYIESQNLKDTDLPAPYSKWDVIIKFASTFDIQSEFKKGKHIKDVFDVEKPDSIY